MTEFCQNNRRCLQFYFTKQGYILTFTTQPAITCSKLTIETLEQGVKYVQS